MPNCQDCRHFVPPNSACSVPCCERKIRRVNKIDGVVTHKEAWDERSFIIWPLSKWLKQCGPKGKYWEIKLQNPTVAYTNPTISVSTETKATAIAELLVTSAGFNEEDARSLVDEIVKIWEGK